MYICVPFRAANIFRTENKQGHTWWQGNCIPLPLTVVLFGSRYKSIGLTLHQQLIEQASLFQLEGWRARVISLELEVNVCGPVTAGRHPFQVL